ncbi:hypothetical protein GCM10023322_04680 [Rugosimonospora acidiphila]|uniref:DUF1707 domain-containing protein n=1 Tax=Rugosimonospora acidiphila TaxID=556531 RepID=A0ABP9RI52_9ACTN
MGERRDDLRAADSDRQFVADRLQAALNEGRLNLSEYDERLQQAYAAKTYGELDGILDDLPPTTSPQDARVASATFGTGAPSGTPSAPDAAGGQPRRGVPPWMLALWGGWLTATVICTVIYVASDFGGYPWPIWVAGPWGAILLIRTLKAYASGDPHRYLAEHHQDQRHRQRLDRERYDRGGFDRGRYDRGRFDHGRFDHGRFDRGPRDQGFLDREESDRRARYQGRQYRWR